MIYKQWLVLFLFFSVAHLVACQFNITEICPPGFYCPNFGLPLPCINRKQRQNHRNLSI